MLWFFFLCSCCCCCCDGSLAGRYESVPSLQVTLDSLSVLPEQFGAWLAEHAFDQDGLFVIKPCLGGSSIGVTVVRGSEQLV